ncbi:MAG: hypothetical protein ACLUMQ_02525 [Streptococcus salivarius]
MSGAFSPRRKLGRPSSRSFAVVREADKRVLGMFPYDVQVMGRHCHAPGSYTR